MRSGRSSWRLPVILDVLRQWAGDAAHLKRDGTRVINGIEDFELGVAEVSSYARKPYEMQAPP